MERVSRFLVVAAAALLASGCSLWTEYGIPVAIGIPNSSFELPDGLTNNGLLNPVDSWTPGGTWYGRFRWNIVPDGEYAVWSSYSYQGTIPDNGWSQELVEVFEAGRYTLTVMALADNTEGLVSGLYLGYDAGGDSYAVLANAEVTISYNPNAPGFDYSDWVTLELTYDVRERSACVGKNIWVRMSTRSDATGVGGNSCWWDDITLTVAYPVS